MQLRTVLAGESVIKLVMHCYGARQALMLSGAHGLGKSELLKAAARRLDVDFICRDLSLMDPSDLTGMPYVDESSRTRFASPAFLPTEGRGILAIEEINRAPRYMWTTCLQLLTERRLNDYRLPDGWLIVASMNPSGDDYLVNPLDKALLSRFVQAEIRPDVKQWSEWARTEGDVHEKVIEFALQTPGIFDSSESNPRSLTYLSNHLKTWESQEGDDETLLTAVSGVVGETWGISFFQFLNGGEEPLDANDVIESYPMHRKKMKAWRSAGQLDLIRASLQRVRHFLESDSVFSRVTANETWVGNLRKFASDLPADLGKEMRDWLAQRGAERFAA